MMRLTITDIDTGPTELHAQTPFTVELLRMLPGDDRPDYWLGRVQPPIRWIHENHERHIDHVILAARWQGTRLEPGVSGLPVGIAYVIDETLLNDSRLSFSKCAYVAIGTADDSVNSPPPQPDGEPTPKSTGILSGIIGRFFGPGRG